MSRNLTQKQIEQYLIEAGISKPEIEAVKDNVKRFSENYARQQEEEAGIKRGGEGLYGERRQNKILGDTTGGAASVSTIADRPVGYVGNLPNISGGVQADWKNPEYVKSMIASIGKQQGLSDGEIAFAIAIAAKESGFNVNAHNKGTKQVPEDSYGVFQINKQAHPDYTAGLDPVGNITYGVKFAAQKLRQAKGDVKKAARNYNGSGKMAENYSNDFVANYYPRYSQQYMGGNINAAAPIPSSNTDLGSRMSDLVQGNVDLAEQGISKYASTPYDPTVGLALRAQRQKEYTDMLNRIVQETPINPTQEQLQTTAQPFTDAQAQMAANSANAMDRVQALTEVDRYAPYEQKIREAYENQIQRLQAANPYTRMANVVPVEPIDRDLMNRRNRVHDVMDVFGASLGLNTPAPNYADMQYQRAIADRAAQIYNATGLTPEQFIEGGIADYQSLGTGLSNLNAQIAKLQMQAQQGDVYAIQALRGIANNLNTNMVSNVANQATAQHQLRQDQLASEKENRERYFNMLQGIQALDPYMVSGGTDIQKQNIGTAGFMYNTGLTSGTSAAGNLANYEGKMLGGANADQDTTPKSQQVISTMLNAAANTGNVDAYNQAYGGALAGYEAAGVDPTILKGFIPVNNTFRNPQQ